jgi:hypothetical protein
MEYQALRADATLGNESFVSTSDEAELARAGVKRNDIYGDSSDDILAQEGPGLDDLDFGASDSIPYIANPY